VIFRQLLDPETSSYTYLLADPGTREAVLIDAVREQLARDLRLLEELELRLLFAVETHVHADHVTAGGLLRERLGCRLVVGEGSGVLTAELRLQDGERLRFGSEVMEGRATPGHTSGCMTYVLPERGMAFTGDALLIRGCGRTDFQGGDPRALFASIHDKIFSLPDDTLLYPAHDYAGRTVTTVAEEKRFNPRLGGGRSADEFEGIMKGLALAYPGRMNEAVPGNMASGLTEPEAAAASTRAGDGWAPVLRTTSGVPVIEPAWLAAHADAVRLVDVREHVEFCGPLGHIESAELVPFADLRDRASSWERSRPIVTVCAYGTRSGAAARMLAEKGFEKVASLHGGMTRWSDEGLPRVEVMGDRARQDAPMWQGADI
jgi:glyoxylase-like metal-dependent hydrolase (beta-lactamase superfamily II)/rhodanese-related sulfurtransferase